MRAYLKASTAVVAIVMAGASAPGLALAADATTTKADQVTTIQDVVVTATRREESANKIPLAIQALGGEALQKLNVQNFEDLVEYLPNVRTASHGPGTSSIYIRGLSTDSPGLQILGTAGAEPNVALYLNDAPSSIPGRNLDVYAVDLQRVEALAGPQGTLFGASAMGGAIRYITNKPDLKAFHAGFDASYSYTKHGDPSASGSGWVNVPIIEDKLAARVVIFHDYQGGYIDNVPGTYQMPFDGHVGQAGQIPTGNPLLVIRALESCPPAPTLCDGSGYNAPTRQSINNAAFVKNHYNDATYDGGRIALTYKVNDDWSVDFMHMRQSLATNGVFDYEPSVGDLQVQAYGNNWLKDDWDETTLTLNGRLGLLSGIYTGSFLNHKTTQQADYANYSSIGLYLPYYECDAGVYYASKAKTAGNTCYTPNKSYHIADKNQRITHEIRVTTPAEYRWRATAGLFFDVNTLHDDTDWSYLQSAAGYIYARSPNPSVNAYDNSVRATSVGFFNDVERKDIQKAAYGEASYDIIPKQLIATLGARYYDERASMTGSSNGSFGGARGIYNPVTGTYSASATPPLYYDVSANLSTTLAGLSPATYSGVISKANLTYKLDDRNLFYATYSEGFRPGGFNRKPCNTFSATCDTLKAYHPDSVRNFELGWKLSLLERTLQFNAALYQINWKDIQMTVFDQNVSNQTFTANFADARIRGFEGETTWRATHELTFNAGFSINDSELTKYIYPKTSTLEPLGSPLALDPKFQGNIRVRYETEWSNGLRPYIQGGVHYVGKTISSDINNVNITYPSWDTAVNYNGKTIKPGDVVSPAPGSFNQPAYGSINAAMGVIKDQITVELFGENLTDSRPKLYTSANDGDLRVTTSRPLTVGLRLSYRY